MPDHLERWVLNTRNFDFKYQRVAPVRHLLPEHTYSVQHLALPNSTCGPCSGLLFHNNCRMSELFGGVQCRGDAGFDEPGGLEGDLQYRGEESAENVGKDKFKEGPVSA